jgi:hypothetical protein
VRKEAADLIKGPSPAELPLENAGKLLSQLDRLEKFIDGVKAHYKLVLAENPDAIPGWGLATKTMRDLHNPEKVKEAVRPVIGEKGFWNAVTVSLTKLEAAWGKLSQSNINEVLAPFITNKETKPSLVKVKKYGTKESDS